MNFRRIMTAMVLLACCLGVASAQVYTNGGPGGVGGPAGALTCTATAAVPPLLRSEGLTEQIGDIVITCTGGTSQAIGSTVPTANITVSLGTNVTSRLLTSGQSGNFAANTSEALLFIDEPTTSANVNSGPGPNAPFNFCNNTLAGAGPGGCVQTVAAGGTATSTAQTTTAAAANVFQGVVSANQVAFNGVPVLAPVSTGVARVYRITNVRANVSALGGGGLAGTTQLLASISISGSASLPVNNPVQVAGLIQSGLTTSLRNTANSGGGGNTNLNQCGGGGPNPLNIVRFQENFPSAFKTRVAPTGTYNGQAGSGLSQSTPGTIYPSESGLVLTTGANGAVPAGLADYGTRLKAQFNNVPAGVRLFVSTSNVINEFQQFAGIPTPPAGNSTTSYGVMVSSETAPDSNGFPPIATANTAISFGSTTLNLVEIPVVNGSATAVWEVINTNPNALEEGGAPVETPPFQDVEPVGLIGFRLIRTWVAPAWLSAVPPSHLISHHRSVIPDGFRLSTLSYGPQRG